MTETERRAQNHLIATMKATMGRSDAAAQEEARASRSLAHHLSNDPEILLLVGNGYKAFEAETARRIFEECGDKVFFNLSQMCCTHPNASREAMPLLRIGLHERM